MLVVQQLSLWLYSDWFECLPLSHRTGTILTTQRTSCKSRSEFLISGPFLLANTNYYPLLIHVCVSAFFTSLHLSLSVSPSVSLCLCVRIGFCQGKFPEFLMDAWDEYDFRKDSDNDRPGRQHTHCSGCSDRSVLCSYRNNACPVVVVERPVI